MRLSFFFVPIVFLLACSETINGPSREIVHQKVVEKFVYDIFSEGNLDVIEEIIAPDYIGYWPGWGEVRGREELRQGIADWKTAFPDWQGRIESIVIDGDTVAFRLTATGTLLGPLGEFQPNEKSVQVAELGISRIAGGLVVEQWEITDKWSLERQLNILFPDSESRPAW